MGEPGFHKTPVGRVRNGALNRLSELAHRRRPVLAFENAGASTHHLGQRPVGDAFAVREAAPSVPAKLTLEPRPCT